MLIDGIINLRVQMFQPIILIYGRVNFVHHHCLFTSVYWSLSYPFRSLIKRAITPLMVNKKKQNNKDRLIPFNNNFENLKYLINMLSILADVPFEPQASLLEPVGKGREIALKHPKT